MTGRHRGAIEAKSDILTFIDDDVRVSPNWLNGILETMTARKDVDLLTGPSLPLYGRPKEELILDPRNYFYHKGVKFLKIEFVREMKDKRNEGKDIKDVRLIDFHLEKNKFYKRLLPIRYYILDRLINMNLKSKK